MTQVLSKKKGGHGYNLTGRSIHRHVNCPFACGCWVSSTQSHGPDGVDPHGKCPKNPLNIEKEAGKMELVTAESMVGKNLAGFTIREYTEVFNVDDDGRKTVAIGYFKSDTIAKAFVQNGPGATYRKTEKVLLLTNGNAAFLLGESVKLMDDEKAALKIREAAMKKLSPEERKILKL